MVKEEIQHLYAVLKRDAATRQTHYKNLEDVFWNNKHTRSIDAIAEIEDRKSSEILYNLIKARVNSKINLLRMLPDIVVSPPPVGPPEDQPFWAEFMTKVLYSYWDKWRMISKLPQMGFHLALKGAVGLCLFPDLKNQQIRLYIDDPANCYAMQDAEGELFCYASASRLKGWQIHQSYPSATLKDGKKIDGQGEYEVLRWWDKTDYRLFVEGEPIPGVGVKHDYGFVPATIISDIPGRLFGNPALYQELAMQENLNDIILMYTESLRQRLRIQYHAPANGVDPDWKPGEGVVMVDYQAGDQPPGIIAPTGAPPDISYALAEHERMFRSASAFPVVGSGQSPASSIVTGPAISALQSVISDDIASTKAAIGEGLIYINRRAVDMERIIFKKQTIKASGEYQAESYAFEYKGTDLPDDFKHQVIFHPLGRDLPTMIVNFLQLQQAGILSKRTVRERLPGIQADEEERRIAEEMEKDIQQQMALQQAAQGQEQGQGTPQGGMAQDSEQFAISQAMGAGGIPPEMLEGMQPMGQGAMSA